MLDVRGLTCPLPILKLKKALGDMQSGDVVRLEATDAGSVMDIPAFIKQTGHTLISQATHEDVFVFNIEKK